MMPEAFEPLLKAAMGLDAASIGSAAIQRAVRERFSACKLKDIHAYWDHLHASKTELQELIEAVIVPETWFFRDRGAFAALARLAQNEWPRSRPDGVIRLLSLPCSTGEEPYSMVMALADSGLPLHRLHVDAVDISGRALAYAQHGVYTKNSFRGNDFGFRDRHFTPAPHHGHRLADAMRQPVHFLQGNLIDAHFLPGVEIYDVIFCRNLLIYFDRATQDHVVAVLARLLAANGFLFVGPSETALLQAHGFESAKMPMSFAFRKAGTVPRESKAHAVPSPKRAPPRPKAVSPAPARPPRHDRPAGQKVGAIKEAVVQKQEAVAVKPHSPPAAKTQPPLHEAEQLANQGKLAQAMEYCEKHVREHGPSAEAFSLMGLVHDAAGREQQAHQSYRRALYLEPTHHETLIHLAVLLEKQGDKAAAQVLYARAKRTQTGNAK